MRKRPRFFVLLALLAVAGLPGLAQAEDEATPSPVAPEETSDKCFGTIRVDYGRPALQ